MTDVHGISGIGVKRTYTDCNTLDDNCPWNIAARQVMQKHDLDPNDIEAYRANILNDSKWAGEINELSNKIIELNKDSEDDQVMLIPLEYAAEEIQGSLDSATEQVTKATSDFEKASSALESAYQAENAAENTYNSITIPDETKDDKGNVTNRDYIEQVTKNKNEAYQKYIEAQSKRAEAEIKKNNALIELNKANQEANNLQKELSENQDAIKEAQESLKNNQNQINEINSKIGKLKEAQAKAEEAAKAAENKAADGGNVEETKVATDTDVDTTSVEKGSNPFIEESEKNGDSTDNVKITIDDNYELGENNQYTKINGKTVTKTEKKENSDGSITYTYTTDDNKTYTATYEKINNENQMGPFLTESTTTLTDNSTKQKIHKITNKTDNVTMASEYTDGKETKQTIIVLDNDGKVSNTTITEYDENGTKKEEKVTKTDAEGKITKTITEYDENGKETKVIETDAEGKKTEKTPATVTRNGKVLDVYKDGDGYISKDGKTKYNANGLITKTTDPTIQKELKQEWANATADYVYSLMWDNTLNKEDGHTQAFVDIFFETDSYGNYTHRLSKDDYNLIVKAYNNRYDKSFEETYDRLTEESNGISDADDDMLEDAFANYENYSSVTTNLTINCEISDNDNDLNSIIGMKLSALELATTSCGYGDKINENVLYNIFADLTDEQTEFIRNERGGAFRNITDHLGKNDDEFSTAYKDILENTGTEDSYNRFYDKEKSGLNIAKCKNLSDADYKNYVNYLVGLAEFMRAAYRTPSAQISDDENDYIANTFTNMRNETLKDLETVFNELYDCEFSKLRLHNSSWSIRDLEKVEVQDCSTLDAKGFTKNNTDVLTVRKQAIYTSTQHKTTSPDSMTRMFLTPGSRLSDEEIKKLVDEQYSGSIQALCKEISDLDNDRLEDAIKTRIRHACG